MRVLLRLINSFLALDVPKRVNRQEHRACVTFQSLDTGSGDRSASEQRQKNETKQVADGFEEHENL